jgi:exopolyphosphatase/guanosine-5'-triphosphate,3'-diphosphate pyrophosphatase
MNPHHYDSPALRVAAIDMGTNSTRLLVADVNGEVETIRRESRVTGLGRGVETSGRLATDAIDRVMDVVGDYAEEARMTYRGAVSGHKMEGETLVVDIGGGSTELIVGSGEEPSFHTSLQLGVVRQSERHVHADPPRTEELEALASDVGSTLESELACHPGLRARHAIAVAGTPATLAAIDLGLEQFDAERVEGHHISLRTAQKACSQLASVPLEQRRQIRGVDPDRAPTIVAGVVILIKAMRAFGLEDVEVSDRDILYGAAIAAANGNGTANRNGR